jgi:RNA polymerase sigma factor (sigma-70 family)
MGVSFKQRALRQLDRLFREGVGPDGDGALLARYLAQGDESAFSALVARHGPMVLGVCRRLLVNSHDADDAFQATFLVLVRKAAQLRDPDRLGPWLYGVANRVASKARKRRKAHDPLVDTASVSAAPSDWHDLRPILDAELCRLSHRHREVLVLCFLEGATAEEASRRLGCPVGTVKSRLARGRESLRARLVQRGVAPAGVAFSGAEALSAPVSEALLRATLSTIAAPAVAPGLLAITQGATSSMLVKSTIAGSALLGALAVVGLGTLGSIRPSLAQHPGAPGSGGGAQDDRGSPGPGPGGPGHPGGPGGLGLPGGPAPVTKPSTRASQRRMTAAADQADLRSIAERLQRVEEKLDRILDQLNRLPAGAGVQPGAAPGAGLGAPATRAYEE